MNPIQAIATLRKFANYLVGIFPFLAFIGDYIYGFLRKIGDLPPLKPLVAGIGQSSVGQAIWKFFERFYWRDYAKDRMELGAASSETAPVLRLLIQMSVLLSLAIPFTQLQLTAFGFGSVSIETFSGYKHAMASWPIFLWILCLPCAWSALLVGTAACNRITFSATAVGALYFLASCILYLPRSYCNALLTAPILFSLIFNLAVLPDEGRRARIMRLLTAITVGAASGFQFTILTPLRPWLGTVLPFEGPVIGIGAGCTVGICAGLVCLMVANKLRADQMQAPQVETSAPLSQNPTPISQDPLISIQGAFLINSILLIGFLCATALRGGLAPLGGAIVSALDMSNAYLWPILYFIGVGIVHKLMGSSKVVATSVNGILPKKFATPLFLLALLVATVAAWSEDIINMLSFQTTAFGQQAFLTFIPFFTTVKAIIWHDPLLSMAAHWMKWVLLCEVGIVSTLAVQKRLNAAVLSRLFFISSLAALLIWEYIFQMSSFARSPIHSSLLIWLFAVWLLWLMHTIGWKLSINDSPMWPSRGRLAIYGGIVGLIILQVNARASCFDYRIVNELFLTMFRGVIDVGLPYYLLLWVNRRIKEATPPVGVLLGAYSAGAIASMCFNAIDKCFTNAGFFETVKTQLQNLQATGNLSLDVEVSGYWLFFKAAVFVALLAVVRRVAAEKCAKVQDSSHPNQRYHWMLYMMLAFASGVVSFSYTFVDLPLPNELRVALAPLHQEVLFNCNVLHLYLAYWLPSLWMCVAALKHDRPKALPWVTLAATMIGGMILAGYEYLEVFLRASGLLLSAVITFTAVMVALIAMVLQILESDRTNFDKPKDDEKKPAENALLSYTSTAFFAMVVSVAFCVATYCSPERKTFSFREVPSLKHAVPLASDWTLKETQAPKEPFPEISIFTRSASLGVRRLETMTLESDPAGVKHLMQKWIDYLHLKVTKVESWERYHPGAYSFQFALTTEDGGTMFAVSAFVPRDNGKTEVFSAITDPKTIEQTIWEIAFLVQNLEKAAAKTTH
jgi:hypothetical protein